jgi:hypothetical protein
MKKKLLIIFLILFATYFCLSLFYPFGVTWFDNIESFQPENQAIEDFM